MKQDGRGLITGAGVAQWLECLQPSFRIKDSNIKIYMYICKKKIFILSIYWR